MTDHKRIAVVITLAILSTTACSEIEQQVHTTATEQPAAPVHQVDADSTALWVQFVDVSEEAGLTFVNVSGSTTRPPEHIVETQSAGVAFFDYDNDGWLDIFVTNGTHLGVDAEPEGATNRLFRNTTGPDGVTRVFHAVTDEAGLRAGGWAMGCAVGDYTNDGYADLYVTYYGPNRLYRNQGDGRFAEVTEQAGVGDPGWGTSAAFGDLDNNGLLDLYIVNYLEVSLTDPPGGGRPCIYKGLEVYCGPRDVPRQADVVYRNRGDGTFEDMSQATGIAHTRSSGLGVIFGDYTHNGWQDIYVANDGEANMLYVNQGNWQWKNVGALAGAAYSLDGMAQAGMGVHAGDVNNDGWMDLFVTNFADDVNTLYRNEGGDLFTDVTYAVGLGGVVRPYLGWSTGFFDYDNDGWLDLYVANGHLYTQLQGQGSGLRYNQRNLLFRNLGDGTFEEVGREAGPGFAIELSSRGAALGDFDNDGDIDLVVNNMNAPPSLLRNEGGNWNEWLGLKLIGTRSNRDAIGARVRVESGELIQTREVQRGYGFQSANDPRLVFGLSQRQQVERIQIRWPSGLEQVVKNPPLRRYLTVHEDRETILAGDPVPPPVLELLVRQPPEPEVLPAVGESHWNLEDYIEAGKDYYNSGRYAEARAAFEAVIRREPNHVQAHVHLGVVFHSGLGMYAEAARMLEHAVTQDPERAGVQFVLAKTYLGLNQPERAVAAMEKTVELSPYSWEAHNWLGHTYEQARRLDLAEKAFLQATGHAPELPGPHLSLMRLYQRLERHEEAERHERIFRRLHEREQRLERHLDDYRRQLARRPEDHESLTGMGFLYMALGDLLRAQDYFLVVLEEAPEDPRALYGMGVFYHRQNRLEAAIDKYEAALLRQPEYPQALNDLGQAYYRLGQFDRAIAAYIQAAVLRPDVDLIHRNLAAAYEAAGQYREALRSWERVTRLTGEEPRVVAHIERLRRRLGE